MFSLCAMLASTKKRLSGGMMVLYQPVWSSVSASVYLVIRVCQRMDAEVTIFLVFSDLVLESRGDVSDIGPGSTFCLRVLGSACKVLQSKIFTHGMEGLLANCVQFSVNTYAGVPHRTSDVPLSVNKYAGVPHGTSQ